MNFFNNRLRRLGLDITTRIRKRKFYSDWHFLYIGLYRVIQEVRLIFLKVRISVIERKTFIWKRVQIWMFTEIKLFDSAKTNALSMVTKKEILLIVNFVLILIKCLKWHICFTKVINTLRFTINVWKSHHQPQCTSQLVHKVRVLFVWVDLHVSVCGQQHPECERAICLVYQPFFCERRALYNPTNKNLMELSLEIQTALSR